MNFFVSDERFFIHFQGSYTYVAFLFLGAHCSYVTGIYTDISTLTCMQIKCLTVRLFNQ